MVGGRKRNKKIILPKAEVRNEQKLESKRFGLNRIQGTMCREKVSFRRRPKVYGNETKEQTEGLRTTFVSLFSRYVVSCMVCGYTALHTLSAFGCDS